MKQRGSFFRGFLLIWRRQLSQEKCRLHMEYLKIWALPDCAFMAEVARFHLIIRGTICGIPKEESRENISDSMSKALFAVFIFVSSIP